MCLNQAIDKMQQETQSLTDARNSIIQIMEDQVESEKLSNLLQQMRTQHHVSNIKDYYGTFNGAGQQFEPAPDRNSRGSAHSSVMGHENVEFEKSKF